MVIMCSVHMNAMADVLDFKNKEGTHMKVELVSHTPDALELLLLTKDVRLNGEAQSLVQIKEWPMEQKLEHLAYMLDTIKSSWEFVEYVFKISDVTRAFTHQFVRTRSNSYAQESQRTVDVSDHSWTCPERLTNEQGAQFNECAAHSVHTYINLLDDGAHPSDARGILPTNMHTNIMVKVNLRSLSDMALVRLCTRTQGEYQDVFRMMRQQVILAHPWAADFIKVWCAAHGTCYFPRYKDCPIQKYTYHGRPELHQSHLADIEEVFWATRHEAKPVAFKGRTK
jgi:flavin-dependent thymidylate synthase